MHHIIICIFSLLDHIIIYLESLPYKYSCLQYIRIPIILQYLCLQSTYLLIHDIVSHKLWYYGSPIFFHLLLSQYCVFSTCILCLEWWYKERLRSSTKLFFKIESYSNKLWEVKIFLIFFNSIISYWGFYQNIPL